MGHTKFTDTELEPTMPKRGPISSPTYATVNSSQYRNSYPPSRRGCHGHPQGDEPHDVNRRTSTRPVPEFRVQDEGPSRPRRSSLRQPQDFNKNRRRKSTSAKRVHFSRAEMVYEPFGPQDVQTVDQILELLRIPSRKIPYTSSHSVTLRPSEAVHDYPEPVVSSRERIRNAKPLSAELVEGPATSGPGTHGSQPGVQKSDQDQPKLKSRWSSRHQPDAYHPDSLPHADKVDQHQPGGDSRVDARSEGQKLHSRSLTHCHGRPLSHTEPRSNIDSHYRPYSHVSEHVRNAAPARKRSSISSDVTLINPDVTWAPASKVMFVRQQGESESAVDADKPIVNQSENSLHRSDAQRVPKVPRRHKLLRNLAKMFE